jgi:hypothetical protein
MLLFWRGAVLSDGTGCVCTAAVPDAPLRHAVMDTAAPRPQSVMMDSMPLAQANATAKRAAGPAQPIHRRSLLKNG